jgi:hypothetical protein
MEIDERGRLEREAGTSIGGLLRGCLTEKIAGKNRRTLSHEHTIFRDAIFPDACARTWWEIGGGKKHHPFPDGVPRTLAPTADLCNARRVRRL